MDEGRDRKNSLQDLIDVMAALRTPQSGCPWDLKQTFETIAPYTIEEAYEVADAITRGDLVDLEEELGDLLLQVVYHARIAEERDAFDMSDVIDGITRKMIRRHPHVFGTPEERAQGAAPGFWERIKDQERATKAAKREGDTTSAIEATGDRDENSNAERPSVLGDVPLGLPALSRAIKLQNKAARVGFDWPDLAPVYAKMREELSELEETLDQRNPEHQREEFGDLLFVMANVARHLKIDPEDALSVANAKFTRRFQAIERDLDQQGRTPADSNLAEMDELWDAAKQREKSRPDRDR